MNAAEVFEELLRLKSRIYWVIGIAVPLVVSWCVWVSAEAKTAGDAVRERAPLVEVLHETVSGVKDLQEKRRDHARALNWIGQALEQIAATQGETLPARPVVSEE